MVAASSRGSQFPSWGSGDRTISKFPSGSRSNSSSTALALDAIPDITWSPT